MTFSIVRNKASGIILTVGITPMYEDQTAKFKIPDYVTLRFVEFRSQLQVEFTFSKNGHSPERQKFIKKFIDKQAHILDRPLKPEFHSLDYMYRVLLFTKALMDDIKFLEMVSSDKFQLIIGWLVTEEDYALFNDLKYFNLGDDETDLNRFMKLAKITALKHLK